MLERPKSRNDLLPISEASETADRGAEAHMLGELSQKLPWLEIDPNSIEPGAIQKNKELTEKLNVAADVVGAGNKDGVLTAMANHKGILPFMTAAALLLAACDNGKVGEAEQSAYHHMVETSNNFAKEGITFGSSKHFEHADLLKSLKDSYPNLTRISLVDVIKHENGSYSAIVGVETQSATGIFGNGQGTTAEDAIRTGFNIAVNRLKAPGQERFQLDDPSRP